MYLLPEDSNGKQDSNSFDMNNAVDKVADMYDKYTNLQRHREEHITKREAIASNERMTIERIRAQRDIIKDYLDDSFRERRIYSDKWFSELDKAIETNNLELMDRSCNAIMDMGRNNPLSHIAQIEKSRKFLESNEEIDL